MELMLILDVCTCTEEREEEEEEEKEIEEAREEAGRRRVGSKCRREEERNIPICRFLFADLRVE